MLPRGWAALPIVAALASSASAQGATDEFGIERFRLAMDRAGLLDVEWAGVPGHLSWGAGLLVGFAHEPLVIYDREMNAVEPVVEGRLTTSIVGSLALWNRLELGVTVDVVGYQSGTQLDVGAANMRDIDSGGIGDLRLTAKALLADSGTFQIALVPALIVPGGSAGGYLREAGVAFSPALAVSGRFGRARAALNLGYHLKPRVDTAGLVSDDEGFARAGIGVALGDVREPVVELWWTTSAATPLTDAEQNQVAIEMLLGAGRQLTSTLGAFVAGGAGLDNGFGTPDWRALAGVRYEVASGDRDRDHLEGDADRCPDDAEDDDGFEDNDGCPDPDNDGDGLADGSDKCPLAAEDKDGFEDDDGCADTDNDRDGVADAQDRCPMQAEDKDGFADDDGCADALSKLAGRVVDPDGRPIAGARVTIEQLQVQGSTPLELTADTDGRFAAELHGGTLKVSASAGEYKASTTDTTLAAGTTGEVTVKLVRAIRQGQLRGQVLAFDGTPLAATITVKGLRGSEPANAGERGKTTATATADAQGQFTVELPAGAFTVEISSPSYVTQKRNVTIKLDGVTVLNVDLQGTK